MCVPSAYTETDSEIGHARGETRWAWAAHMSCVSSIFFMMALEGTRYMSRWFWLVCTESRGRVKVEGYKV